MRSTRTWSYGTRGSGSKRRDGRSWLQARKRAGSTTGSTATRAGRRLAIDAIEASEFDALLVPGGFAPDKLRRIEHVKSLVRDFNADGKLIAFICHAGWVLISAGILRGRRATSTVGIRDDMLNAGAIWLDEPLVVDGNLVSSRTPADLPQFGQGMVQWLKQGRLVGAPRA